MNMLRFIILNHHDPARKVSNLIFLTSFLPLTYKCLHRMHHPNDIFRSLGLKLEFDYGFQRKMFI